MQVLPEVVLVAGVVAAVKQEVEGQRDGKSPGQARNLGLLHPQGPSGHPGNRHELSVCRMVRGSGNCLGARLAITGVSLSLPPSPQGRARCPSAP